MDALSLLAGSLRGREECERTNLKIRTFNHVTRGCSRRAEAAERRRHLGASAPASLVDSPPVGRGNSGSP